MTTFASPVASSAFPPLMHATAASIVTTATTMNARKRQYDATASPTSVLPDSTASSFASAPTDANTAPVMLSQQQPKRRKVSAASRKAKKPQMRYDPAVPMSKEQATVWRREQRRKRNRESAAASRQRQRDRITELEGEIKVHESDYAALMAKIRHLEQVAAQRGLYVPPPESAQENAAAAVARATVASPVLPAPVAVHAHANVPIKMEEVAPATTTAVTAVAPMPSPPHASVVSDTECRVYVSPPSSPCPIASSSPELSPQHSNPDFSDVSTLTHQQVSGIMDNLVLPTAPQLDNFHRLSSPLKMIPRQATS